MCMCVCVCVCVCVFVCMCAVHEDKHNWLLVVGHFLKSSWWVEFEGCPYTLLAVHSFKLEMPWYSTLCFIHVGYFHKANESSLPSQAVYGIKRRQFSLHLKCLLKTNPIKRNNSLFGTPLIMQRLLSAQYTQQKYVVICIPANSSYLIGNIPILFPPKREKKEWFLPCVPIFAKKSVCSNVWEIQEYSYFWRFSSFVPIS